MTKKFRRGARQADSSRKGWGRKKKGKRRGLGERGKKAEGKSGFAISGTKEKA